MSWEPGEQIFNLKALQQELDQQEPEEDMGGNRRRTVYIGTVMGMTPSGKFYTPWACGNVDACPECKGSGEVDNLMREYIPKASADVLHKQAEAIDHKIRELAIRHYGAFCEGNWPSELDILLGYAQDLVSNLKPKLTCMTCEGLGSREAFLDQQWHEQVEEELDKIGAWMESGEGDPCDLFVVQSVDEDDE